VIVYGEVGPDKINVSVGQRVFAGEILGVVETAVLTSFKGRPNIMLHLELMSHGRTESLWWMDLSGPPPAGLLDPTEHLKRAAPESPQFELSAYDGKAFADRTQPRKASRWWAVWGAVSPLPFEGVACITEEDTHDSTEK
jgi:murein DD-endopeptidase MepM/ murein hydrolase activator NlpD